MHYNDQCFYPDEVVNELNPSPSHKIALHTLHDCRSIPITCAMDCAGRCDAAFSATSDTANTADSDVAPAILPHALQPASTRLKTITDESSLEASRHPDVFGLIPQQPQLPTCLARGGGRRAEPRCCGWQHLSIFGPMILTSPLPRRIVDRRRLRRSMPSPTPSEAHGQIMLSLPAGMSSAADFFVFELPVRMVRTTRCGGGTEKVTFAHV